MEESWFSKVWPAAILSDCGESAEYVLLQKNIEHCSPWPGRRHGYIRPPARLSTVLVYCGTRPASPASRRLIINHFHGRVAPPTVGRSNSLHHIVSLYSQSVVSVNPLQSFPRCFPCPSIRPSNAFLLELGDYLHIPVYCGEGRSAVDQTVVRGAGLVGQEGPGFSRQ